MTLKDLADQAGETAVGWSVVGILAGIAWLIRRVFTNQKQIEMMRMSMENIAKDSDRYRLQNKEDMAEIKASQRDMAKDVKQLFQRRDV